MDKFLEEKVMKKSVKKVALVLTMTAMVASMTACGSKKDEKSSESGTAKVYTGTAKGHGGDIKVDVTIDSDKITKVEVVSSENETAGISDPAIADMPQKFIDAQSADVDTVSGCTNTSNGIKDAVANALEQAGFNK